MKQNPNDNNSCWAKSWPLASAESCGQCGECMWVAVSPLSFQIPTQPIMPCFPWCLCQFCCPAQPQITIFLSTQHPAKPIPRVCANANHLPANQIHCVCGSKHFHSNPCLLCSGKFVKKKKT